MSDTTHDEFDGQGGSYLLDPETGKRTLLERTQDAVQQRAEAAPQAAVIIEETPADSGQE